MLRKFKPLRPGATACIVAPAHGVAYQSQVKNTIDQAINIIEMHGLKPSIKYLSIDPGAHSSFNKIHFRFADTDAKRLQYLILALQDEDCDVIWAFKAGYGSMKLIEGLNQSQIPKTVKHFIGFSDITALHFFHHYQII